MKPSRRNRWLAWIAAYLILIAGSWWGLVTVRARAIHAYGTPQAQMEWESWRTAVANRKAGDPAVRRSVPKSPEPPTLVLLRDYFVPCAAMLLLTETALFVTTSFLLVGAIRTSHHVCV